MGMTRRPGDSARAAATAAPTDTSPEPTAPGSTAPHPATARRRLPALDVLRGIAILGTLLTDIWIFSGSGARLDDPVPSAAGPA